MDYETLMSRIHADSVEEGDCLIWQKGRSKVPYMQIDGEKINVRKAILLAKGERVVKGAMFGCSCRQTMCVAEDHIAMRNRNQHAQYFARLGVYSAPAKIAKMALTKRRNSKLDDEKVMAIRASDKTAKELSVEHGVAASYITSIRSGASWKNYSSPFAGLGARS